MNLKEVVTALVWGASAVEVFGFTWEAYKQTYIPFPIGGAAQPAPFSTKKGATLPGAPTTKSGKPKSPPANLITPVVKAVQEGSGTRALAAWMKVVAWVNSPAGRKQGWYVWNPSKTTNKFGVKGDSSLADWAFSQGWFGRFYDLTGWTPTGQSNAGRPTTSTGPIN